MNIFVGSLPWATEEDDLRGQFEAYGEVSSVRIITDKFTGRSKGFGFVEMPDDDAAQKAIDELNGSEMGGRNIVVNKSEPKPEGDRRGGGNRGGNRGGGGFNRGGGGFNRGGNGGGRSEYGRGNDRGGRNRDFEDRY